jgi:hypothetical protein
MLFVMLGAATAAAAIVNHTYRPAATGRRVPGGILIGDAEAYDRLSHRILLGGFFGGIVADIGSSAGDGARVLEVGCGTLFGCLGCLVVCPPPRPVSCRDGENTRPTRALPAGTITKIIAPGRPRPRVLELAECEHLASSGQGQRSDAQPCSIEFGSAISRRRPRRDDATGQRV